jgi:hypothetical protein
MSRLNQAVYLNQRKITQLFKPAISASDRLWTLHNYQQSQEQSKNQKLVALLYLQMVQKVLNVKEMTQIVTTVGTIPSLELNAIITHH